MVVLFDAINIGNDNKEVKSSFAEEDAAEEDSSCNLQNVASIGKATALDKRPKSKVAKSKQ